MAGKSNASKSMLSTSCFSSVAMVAYFGFACFNLYKIMYPLTFRDLTIVPPEEFANPLWDTEEPMHMRVYLSSKARFEASFLESEFPSDVGSSPDTVLMWKQDVDAASLSKSFLLTSLECAREGKCDPQEDASLQHAQEWLDHTDNMLLQQDGGVLSTISAAGQGVESTSILLTSYQTVSKKMQSLWQVVSAGSDNADKEDPSSRGILEQSTIYLSPDSPMWSRLMSNSTVHIHVVATRQKKGTSTPANAEEAITELERLAKANSLLQGQVGLVKFDNPTHLSKPGRLLYKDVVYLFNRYILGDTTSEIPPWDMEYSKPEYYRSFQELQQMKQQGSGYPYWKPEVAVKYLIDTDSYPLDIARVSGMKFVRVRQSQAHPSGIAHTPALHVDEIGLTSEKYIPLNQTVTSLPLHISFDRSDMKDEHHVHATTATAGGISPARWRLLTHLSASIESQKELGFEQSDIDDLRRLIADTNATLLGITMLASALHLLFEFLTFKNEVSFWRNNTDLIGLSVRSLFLDMVGQVIIVLFLVEKDSSLLMTIPSAIGCLIALWKCQRAAGLDLVRLTPRARTRPAEWWNVVPRLMGYEIRARRMEVPDDASNERKGDEPRSKADLHALTMECDRIATQRLGVVFLPLVLAYTFYSFVNEEHSGWYSWLITSASSAVYALGFVLMTPQLFLNYKLKSVAHLPWRVLVYKSLNTFIDDLFSFIIRMPTMARISCFRDDIVFFIYLYQRWLYPVDESRPVEGGGDGTESKEVSDTKKKQ